MYSVCGPRQLFFQCGPETPKGWTPLVSKDRAYPTTSNTTGPAFPHHPTDTSPTASSQEADGADLVPVSPCLLLALGVC